MRVLHAYSQHRSGGGATKVTEDTIALCRQRGLDVEVVTRRSNDLPKNLLGHVQAGLSAFRGGESVDEFCRVMDAFHPDIVHVHELFPKPSPWIIPECSRRGIPVVMNWNDYHLTCPARNHYREGAVCTLCVGGHERWAVLKNCRGSVPESVTMALYCAMLRKKGIHTDHVTGIVVLSDFSRNWLVEHVGVDPARIATISPLIEMPETAADPGAGTYVAFGGRFVPEKGIDTLLEAAQMTSAPLRLSRNRQHFVTVEIPANIDVVVTSTPEEVVDLYRGARMVVMPSAWFETFGMVAAEAMSHGVPVIVSRIGALSELVEDGVDGLLFEPGNAVDLASKIDRLWNDPELCRRLGAAARAKAQARWSPTAHFEKLTSFYQSLLGRPPGVALGA